MVADVVASFDAALTMCPADPARAIDMVLKDLVGLGREDALCAWGRFVAAASEEHRSGE